MEFEKFDYQALVEERITYQFKGALNIERLTRVWTEGFQEIQDTLLAMPQINDVETARGKNLEVIGDIVGQPRGLLQISSTGHFGFESDPGAKSFGSVKNDRGGVYYSLRDPESGSIELKDTDFRLFVKSKIVQNNTGSTPEDIIKAAEFIFQTEEVELFEGTDSDELAVLTLNIGRAWNDEDATFFPGLDETAIADSLLPKPAGVRIDYIDTNVKETLDPVDYWWNIASLNLYHTANTALPTNLDTTD